MADSPYTVAQRAAIAHEKAKRWAEAALEHARARDASPNDLIRQAHEIARLYCEGQLERLRQEALGEIPSPVPTDPFALPDLDLPPLPPSIVNGVHK